MKRVAAWTLFTLLVLPSLGVAQSVFNGTWKADPGSFKNSSNNTSVLKDGVYSCKSCTPPYQLKADGKFHKVAGQSGFDMEAIQVIDDRTVRQTRMKDGKKVGNMSFSVAPDGQAGTETFHSFHNGHTMKGQVTLTRVAPGPAGSHATSGTWRLQHVDVSASSDITATYNIEDESVEFSDSMGYSYLAKLNGIKVQIHGDDPGEMVSVAMPDPHTLVETYWKKDKAEGGAVTIVAPDDSSAKVVSYNLKDGSVSSYTMTKQ